MTRQHQSALNRLGFRDPDKENPRHGLACEYLMEKMRPIASGILLDRMVKAMGEFIFHPEHAVKLWFDAFKVDGWHWRTKGTQDLAKDAWYEYIGNCLSTWVSSDIGRMAELSSLVTGPASGAKGFLDVSIRGQSASWYIAPDVLPVTGARGYGDDELRLHDVPLDGDGGQPRRPRFGRYPGPDAPTICMWGEVRIEPTTPELLLQQIEFYSSNLDSDSDQIWVLADFDLSDFKRMASPQFPQLRCFRLGEQFEKWCHERPQTEIDEL